MHVRVRLSRTSSFVSALRSVSAFALVSPVLTLWKVIWALKNILKLPLGELKRSDAFSATH